MYVQPACRCGSKRHGSRAALGAGLSISQGSSFAIRRPRFACRRRPCCVAALRRGAEEARDEEEHGLSASYGSEKLVLKAPESAQQQHLVSAAGGNTL